MEGRKRNCCIRLRLWFVNDLCIPPRTPPKKDDQAGGDNGPRQDNGVVQDTIIVDDGDLRWIPLWLVLILLAFELVAFALLLGFGANEAITARTQVGCLQ
jgi:hypothetical protein